MRILFSILFFFALFPANTCADTISRSSKELAKCAKTDTPICLLRFAYPADVASFLPPEIAKDESIVKLIYPEGIKVETETNEKSAEFNRIYGEWPNLVVKAIEADLNGKNPDIALFDIKNHAKTLKPKPLPFLGYSMPSGNEIRAMAYSKIAEFYFDENSDVKPSLALTKAALAEWEKEHLKIKDNYLKYWVYWTELIDYYFILGDSESIDRMAKTQPKTKGYIQYKKFSAAIKDKDFPAIARMSLENYSGIRELEVDSHEFQFEELKATAFDLLVENGLLDDAKKIAKLYFKENKNDRGLKMLAKALSRSEFLEFLKPYDEKALLKDETAIAFKKKGVEFSYFYPNEDRQLMGDVRFSILGHQMINDTSLNETILENWRFLAITPPNNFTWQSFESKTDYPWEAYQALLLIADRPVVGIKEFHLPIRTAITWDIQTGKGLLRISEYAKLSENSEEIEMALSNCVENFSKLDGYSKKQLTELKTNCVLSHAKFSLNRDFTKRELEFLHDSFIKKSPPYKTSKAGLAEIAAKQVGEEAKIGNLKTAEEVLEIMFKALEGSPDFEFDLFADLGPSDYAIAKLKQQNRLKKDEN